VGTGLAPAEGTGLAPAEGTGLAPAEGTGPAPAPTRPVAAVVVNFNAADELGACLGSLAANGVSTVVVVDNGSVDHSEQVVRAAGAEWLPTGANLGYGRAANRGAAISDALVADYLLVCNPDLELCPGAVEALVSALLADPDLGIVGPGLWNDDGTLYPSARTFPDMVDAAGHGLLGLVAPGNRFTRRYRLLDWDHSHAARVDWVSGACFLARRPAWDAVGGFDPAYFMYMEDVDLCWRINRAGWAVGYEPAARVRHTQGVSTGQRPYRMLVAHHRSMWRFAWRTTEGRKRAILPVVAMGLVARLAAASFEHRLGRSRRPGVPAQPDVPTNGAPDGRGTGRTPSAGETADGPAPGGD
jgi:N-acetylglucosaminyl-diphospho-decaprenol L-rhamnosyltransferase